VVLEHREFVFNSRNRFSFNPRLVIVELVVPSGRTPSSAPAFHPKRD